MNRIYATVLVAFLSLSAFSQKVNNVELQNRAAKMKKARTGQEFVVEVDQTTTKKKKPNSFPMVMKDDHLSEEIIMETTYDLQTNSSVQNRLYYDGTNWAAACTFSEQTAPGSPDRGTGYASNEDGAGWNSVGERVESFRTGWTSLFKTAGGRECIVNHPGEGFNFLYRDAGIEDWTEEVIPTEFGITGTLWPRACAGGADGNSIHVIGVTTPVGNGGVEELGQDGALLYWRSTDQGDTWDIVDFQDASIDSTNFLGFGGDSYSLACQGDRVAIAAFNDLADSFVLVSEDNGDTWTKTIIHDFPVDLYEIDVEIIDLDNDGIADTLNSSDGSGQVFFDALGQLHVTYGNMRYMDADLGDNNFSFFPGTSGLMYWNETMPANSSQMIADLEIPEGETEFIFGDEIAGLGVSLTSFPNMASDDNGNLYVTYSAAVSGLIHVESGFNYRHIFAKVSTDGGMNWGPYNDITPFDLEDETETIDCLFGSVYPRIVNDKMALIYQRDFAPGLVVDSEDDDQGDNVIVFLEVEVDFLAVGLDEFEQESPFSIYPNPVVDGLITIEMEARDNFQYQMYDILGSKVKEGRIADLIQTVDVAGLESGLYSILFSNEKEQFSHTLIVK